MSIHHDNKSKTPLDYTSPVKPKLESTSIECAQPKEIEVPNGIALVDAPIVYIDDQVISDEELEKTLHNTNDISDAPALSFLQSETIDVINATDFPTLDGQVGSVEIINDLTSIVQNTGPETKTKK